MSPKLLSLVFVLLLLAGCNKNPFEVVISRCPAVAVIGDIATYSEFKPGATTRRQEDLAFTAAISDITVSCEQNNAVAATVDFSILARRYDETGQSSLQLPYFVAILKDNNTLISKKNFETSVAFGPEGLGRVDDRFLVDIPTIEQARTYSYEILIGFDLEPGDVYYNLVR